MTKIDPCYKAADILVDMLNDLKINNMNEDVQQLVLNVAVAMDNLYFNHYTGYVDSLEHNWNKWGDSTGKQD